MRVIVVNKENLEAFSKLMGDKIGSGSALEQLKNLNPHVDFKKIEPGTVLLIPDGPRFRNVESVSITGDAFNVLREQMLASVDASASRLRAGFDALRTEQKKVAEVLKTPAMTKAIEADPDLESQIKAANLVFQQDEQLAEDAKKVMKTLKEQVDAELKSLTQLLG